MQLIVASDIFGNTPAFREIADEVSANFESVYLVDPYNRQRMEFENETVAYAYFKENVGLDRYTRIVSESISRMRGPVRLLGFSVGASAIWSLSGNQDLHQHAKAVCFYGSQIRHFVTMLPKIKMELFFPHFEPHFDVAALMSLISKGPNVRCHQTAYRHGFMNKDSVNFDADGYRQYLQIIIDRLI